MTTEQPSTPPRNRFLTRDQRLQAQTLRQAGLTYREIAKQLKVSIRQVAYAVAHENLSPKKGGGRPPRLCKEQLDELESFVRNLQQTQPMSIRQLTSGPFKHWNVSRKVIRTAIHARGCSRFVVMGQASTRSSFKAIAQSSPHAGANSSEKVSACSDA